MFYLCSENKGADQLRGYREADLRLCFRICKKPVFSRRGSILSTLGRLVAHKYALPLLETVVSGNSRRLTLLIGRSNVRSAMRAASQLPGGEHTDVDDAPAH